MRRKWMMNLGCVSVCLCLFIVVTLPVGTGLAESKFNIDKGIPSSEIRLWNLPKKRSFLLGGIYQPYDWKEEAFDKTFETIKKHSDMIVFFDNVGIPWPEALDGKEYHPAVEAELLRRQKGIKGVQNVMYITSFLGANHQDLALYRGEKDGLPRPGNWANRGPGDLEVIQAYLNYCRDLIKRFDPHYFGYVAAVDSAFTNSGDEKFKKVLEMCKTVYTQLKKEYPKLTVFAEFTLGEHAYMMERIDVIKALLPYTDLYAVSTYPSGFAAIAGDATKLPQDWFSRVAGIAPGKRFAVTETAFHAEHVLHPTLGAIYPGHKHKLLIPGGEKSQALYFRRLLEEAHKLDAAFVNIWTLRDLDLRYHRMERADPNFYDPMFRFVMDTGLINERGEPRPALRIWEAWRRLPFSGK